MIAINGRFLTQRITGVQRYATEIAKRLIAADPSIRCVAPRSIAQTSTAHILNAEQFGHLRGHAWEQLELPLWMARTRTRMLVNLGNAAPLAIRKQIVVIHDAAVLRYPQWYSRSYRTAYQLMLPRIARRAVHVVTVSEFSRRELTQFLGLSPDRISVVPAAGTQPPSGRRTIQRENIILAVSSIARNKNLKRLIRAFELSGLSSHRLVIVGGTSAHFRSYGFFTHTNSNIEFRGYVTDDELEDVYAKAEIFIFPSLYEGFGLPPLEAMARGCAVVVADTASMPEICGDAAIYCNPTDVDSIAAAMRRVASDSTLRVELQQRGYARAREFTWDNSASLFRRVLDIHA